jgi:hypothetical protein
MALRVRFPLFHAADMLLSCCQIQDLHNLMNGSLLKILFQVDLICQYGEVLSSCEHNCCRESLLQS